MGLLDLENAPRGVRNNNPGNIVKGEQWQGLVDGTDPRFATFASPEMGIRALGRNLIAYQDKHGLNTVSDIINRWAPSNENNTGAYIRAVAGALGVGPSDKLNLSDQQTLAKLSKAIIQHENGQQPYSDQQINAGVQMAVGARKPGMIERAVNAIIPSAQADTLGAKQMANPYDEVFAKVMPSAPAAEPVNGQAPQGSPYDAVFDKVMPKASAEAVPAQAVPAQAAPSSAPQTTQQPSQPMPRMDKVMTGVADPIQGGAQLLTHMLPSGVVQAGNDLNNWLADKTGLVARLPAGGVDQQTKEREAAYQAQRAAAGESGFDGYRMIGNVVSPANLAIAGKSMQLANGAKVLGGALGGGASALMNPVSGDDYASEKGKQVAIGTAMGGAVPALMGGVARVISPKASVNPDIALLKSEGVTPTIGQALGGTANKLEQKLTSAPFMGDAIVGARTRALDQFNSAAINRATAPIGVKINQTGAEGVARAQQAISQAYDDALGQIKAVKLDGQFSQDFGQLHQLTRGLTPPMRAKFDQVTANVLGGRAGTTGTMTAETFKRVDSELGNIASKYQGSAVASEKELGDAVAQLGALLKQQAGRSNPQAAQALKAADTAYANLVRVEGAANKSVTSELFTPGQLASAVRQADASVRHRANAAGNALMQDLAGAGQRVLGNNVPDSGTAGRMLPFLTGAGAVASPVATGIGLLGGTTLYSKPVQGLLSGLVTSRPEAAQAVGNSLLKAAPGFGPLGAQMGIGLLGYPSP